MFDISTTECPSCTRMQHVQLLLYVCCMVVLLLYLTEEGKTKDLFAVQDVIYMFLL